jgi:signal transduction histidine kinase/CheY-like chemotaxis protein
MSPKTGQVMLVSAHRIERASRGDGHSDSAVGLVVLDLSEKRWLESQLRHAQRMEALGRLAGGVAHDINNVVTAIIGFTDMAIAGVRAGNAADEVDGDLRQVRRAADRAAVMARQLLSFSRQRIAHERPIDVCDVVHDIEPMLKRILGSHVTFQVFADSKGWAILADPGQIEQVLLNLTINARDAMELGGALTVSVHTVDEASMLAATIQRAWQSDDSSRRTARQSAALHGLPGGVCLVVRDTGSGIPPAVLSRMFEPFFTTKAEGKGTGLGLATVRQIVDDLEGFVTVHSVPGEGSTISVYLPRISGDPEPPRLLASRGSRQPLAGAVLVAEDDRDVRYLVEQVLSDAGYTVHTVRNGGEALTAIERATSPYQLLITDLVMPDVGGVRLGSHALVEEQVGAVLYMSGYPADSYGEQTALPMHVHFLAKPFSPAELLAAVDEAVRANRPDNV